jgi:hypothetical protein
MPDRRRGERGRVVDAVAHEDGRRFAGFGADEF